MSSRTIIRVDVVPHEEQRYDTCADWQFGDDGVLIVKVSDMGSRASELLVAVHEIVEAIACKERGISETSVDSFDMLFNEDGEPGDDPNSPYFEQHALADAVERLLAVEIKFPWKWHEAVVDALPKLVRK